MKALSHAFVKSTLFVVGTTLVQVFPSGASAQSSVSADLSRVGDASHLVLEGLASWKYSLDRDGNKVVLRVPPLAGESLVKLRTHSDALIQKVEVNEAGVDGTHELTFHLKSGDIDFFDYQTEDPAHLIVDFFPKDDKPAKASETVKVGPPPPPASLPSALPAKGKATEKARKPAGTEFMQVPVPQAPNDAVVGGEQVDFGGDGIGAEKQFKHGIFDGGDPTFKRFEIADYDIRESATIASRGNIYLRFPPLKLDSPHLNTLLKNPPIYEIVPTTTRENKEAQLLLTLFNNKRPAVFLKTAKDFLKRHPQSQYDEIIRYMMADTHYDLWQTEKKPGDFETAMGMYRHLSEKYPDSALATRTLLLMGYSYLNRSDNFSALKALQRFLRVRINTKFTDQVKISIAEAYLNLNRFDDAFGLLDEIEKTAKNRKDAVEASYRKGDVFFERKDYAGAIAAYQEAMKKHPDQAGRFPNAYYNRAEAQFWQGRYRDSLNSYREYLERFPEHDHGGYAMTRLGELLEIMGAEEKRALGAYLESFFRYRETPGANVARIRALVSRFPDMKDKELSSSIEEIETLAKKTALPDINEFVAVLIADGHFYRKDFKKSTAGLISFYQQNPNASNREKFQTRIGRNLTEAIRTNVGKGNFIEALRIHSQYAPTWLKNSDRVDTRYYIGRAYEQAGVFKEAANVYRETLNKMYAMRGTPKEKERSVFEVLPESDSLNLRLALVASRERDYSRAVDHLKAIAASPRLTERELIERAEVSADVAEARGQVETAKGYLNELVTTWKGQPVAVSDVYLRLGRLQMQTKNFKDAEASVTKVINLHNDSGLVSEDTHAAALELKGDLLLARGRRSESVSAYKNLLDAYGTKRPLSSVRYKAGKVLFESGELKAAEELWADLKTDKNDLWHKLAQEQLEGAKWNGDYKKYIERIPAMQGMKRE